MSELTSLISVDPTDIASQVDSAIELCENDIGCEKADIRKAYEKMTVRCGFLWLRTRAPTIKEVLGRLSASREPFGNCYDSAWNGVAYLQSDLKRLKNIQDALGTGEVHRIAQMVYLTVEDMNLINTYKEKTE